MSLKNLNVSFIAGCLIDDEMFYISSYFDNLDAEIQCSRMSIYDHLDKQWYYHDNIEFKAISVALVPKTEVTNRIMLAVSLNGDVEFYSTKKTYYEKIKDVGYGNKTFFYGTVNKIRNIQSDYFVCGSRGQVYKKIANDWLHIDESIVLPKIYLKEINPQSILDFDHQEKFREIYDINGHNLGCLYVCGEDNDGGFIACNNTGKWVINIKRTPSSLHHIQLCSDGLNIVAVGDYGTVFYGNSDSGFINLKDISIKDAFYQSCYFKEDLYIASSVGLYKYSKNKFELLDVLPLGTEVNTVDSTENILWVLSDKELYRFDGINWMTITDPDNLNEENKSIAIKANEQCPKPGYWYTFAKENSRQYFKQGDIFPNVNSDWDNVHWYFDGEE